MVEAKAQAKQLDSVTDVVQEQEVDATKAQQAMTALSSKTDDSDAARLAETAADAIITKEDVELIVSELDNVTEDLARQTLRKVAIEMNITQREGNHNALVVAALRKLVTS